MADATREATPVDPNVAGADHSTVIVSVVVPVISVICAFLGNKFVESVIYCPTWNVPVTFSDAIFNVVVVAPVTPTIVPV